MPRLVANPLPVLLIQPYIHRFLCHATSPAPVAPLHILLRIRLPVQKCGFCARISWDDGGNQFSFVEPVVRDILLDRLTLFAVFFFSFAGVLLHIVSLNPLLGM